MVLRRAALAIPDLFRRAELRNDGWLNPDGRLDKRNHGKHYGHHGKLGLGTAASGTTHWNDFDD